MLNGGQFEQLPMFVSAREVRENYRPGDAPIGEGETMWNRKLAEAHGERGPLLGTPDRWKGLHASIAQEGVREPVWAGVAPSGAKTLWEGHHRTVSQYEHDPERLMPILFGAQRDTDPEHPSDQYPANPSGGELHRFYSEMGFRKQ